MCGIVGVLSSEGMIKIADRRKFFLQALYADALRGWDSTGMFFSGAKAKKHNTLVYKRALPSPDFLPQKMTQAMMTRMDYYSFCIGHNRAATKGSVDDNTAHPFQFKDIIGVHNGTLTSHHQLPGGTYDVDSEAIFAAFQKESAESIIPKLEGAFALVWYDARDKMLHAVRNEERTLYTAHVNKQDTILVASEKEMIEWLAHRNQMDIEDPVLLEAGKILSFSSKKVKEIEKKDVTLHKKPTFNNKGKWNGSYYDYNGGNNYNNGGSNYKGNQKPTSKEILNLIDSKPGDQVEFIISKFRPYPNNGLRGCVEGYMPNDPWHQVEMGGAETKDNWEKYAGKAAVATIISGYESNDGFDVVTVKDIVVIDDDSQKKREASSSSTKKFYGPKGKQVDRNEWDKLIRFGCSYCQIDISDEDTGKLAWTYEGDPLCPHCVEEHSYQDMVPRIQ